MNIGHHCDHPQHSASNHGTLTRSCGRGKNTSKPFLICQICSRIGHSTVICWHRTNLQYHAPSSNQPTPQALYARPSPQSHDWTLDSEVTSHLTYDNSHITLVHNDILLTVNNFTAIFVLLSSLHTQFHMHNLGNLSFFLDFQANTTVYGLHLTHSAYASNILRRAGLATYKPIQNPISSKSDVEPLPAIDPDPTIYCHIVGSLQYLTITQPNLSFTVDYLCQHMHQPSSTHFHQLKRVLRYLQGTLSHSIPIYYDFLSLHAYSDSD